MTHTHPCVACGTPVDCDGEQERNDDGWPVVICRAYHLPGGGVNPRCLCDACQEDQP